MAAPTDAAVKDDLDPVAHRIDDIGDKIDRGGAAIKLASAMIRQDHRRSARIGGAQRVVGALQTLNRKRTAPVSCNLRNAFPANMRFHLRGEEGGKRR